VAGRRSCATDPAKVPGSNIGYVAQGRLQTGRRHRPRQSLVLHAAGIARDPPSPRGATLAPPPRLRGTLDLAAFTATATARTSRRGPAPARWDIVRPSASSNRPPQVLSWTSHTPARPSRAAHQHVGAVRRPWRSEGMTVFLTRTSYQTSIPHRRGDSVPVLPASRSIDHAENRGRGTPYFLKRRFRRDVVTTVPPSSAPQKAAGPADGRAYLAPRSSRGDDELRFERWSAGERPACRSLMSDPVRGAGIELGPNHPSPAPPDARDRRLPSRRPGPSSLL